MSAMFSAIKASTSRLVVPRAATGFPRLPILPRDVPASRSFASSPSPSSLDSGEQAIHAKLSAKFPGKRLEVQDVSGGCGSFYAILISSPAFNGFSTIKQHKMVNECLKEDIKTIHGLQLKTIPEDDA